ncbi:MAG: DNA repair protein RecO [Candidatus Roizmanbacteria bacterium]|nr:DNA repair protein RecO [Candidatus Roizmanbacteria bacterium]
MEKQSWEGIVLRKGRSKERDQLLVIFNKERGKQFVLAKGANSITSRRVGIIDTFNVIHFDVAEHAGYTYLRNVDLVSRLQVLKDNSGKRTALLLAMDVLNRLLPVEEPETQLYEDMQQYLRTLAISPHTKQVTYHFLVTILTTLGYYHDDIVTFDDILRTVEEITQRDIRKTWKFLDATYA